MHAPYTQITATLVLEGLFLSFIKKKRKKKEEGKRERERERRERKKTNNKVTCVF